ncbi:MAG: anhydro-N-acetylmuramic acid kinase [Legionella sp.]|nr:anhydro-N-acetylmuramic acid kinase [Legionella sp.]
MKLFIGLMSGTSMDGIDAALVDLETNSLVYGVTCPYSKEAKEALLKALAQKAHSAGFYSQLNTLLGREFAKTVLHLLGKSKFLPADIIAIGSHGQTLCHDTTASIPFTVQLGCAHTIAEMTGIKVVADFRTRDLVTGGQGAPFAPIFHQAIFNGQGFPLAILNVGGIANLTYLANEKDVRGYDLGPGNCLLDAWIFAELEKEYDHDGEWASTGVVIDPLLQALLLDPYFERKAPKSIGKEYFSLDWLKYYLNDNYSPRDIQATLLQLTAITIAMGINELPLCPEYLLVCGGGAHNKALLRALSQLLPEVCVCSTEKFNINPDFVEAHMFAWLAEKTVNNIALDLNPITGARHPAILGAIYPAGIDKIISNAV